MSAEPLLSTPPRRILLVVTRRIGDVLLATPVVRSLKSAWPDARIDLLVFAGTAGLVAADPEIDRVLTVPERPGLLEHARLALSIARQYDLALSLVPGDRPTLYAFVAGRRRAGLLVPTRKERWKRALLHRWVAFDDTDTHTVRMHLALLEVLGVSPIADVVPSHTPQDAASARALLAPIGDALYAVLHPYPKFRYKMWTEEGWLDTARWLTARGLRVVLTGGPEPAERDYVAALAAQLPGALDLSGKLTLGAVASAIAGAAVYVGPDTSVTHAAAGLGVPTVAIYGPTNPVKWGPWPRGMPAADNPWMRTGTQSMRNVRLVQGAGHCVPCGKEGCERHVESWSDCLRGLPAARVIAALDELMDTHRA